MTTRDDECTHWFKRMGWTRRWRCVKCGFETRHYDWPDRMALRPVHPHMTVALRGYNTARRFIRG